MGRCQEAGRRKKNLHNTVSPISNEVVLLDENIRIYLREIQRFHGNALERITIQHSFYRDSDET